MKSERVTSSEKIAEAKVTDGRDEVTTNTASDNRKNDESARKAGAREGKKRQKGEGKETGVMRH